MVLQPRVPGRLSQTAGPQRRQLLPRRRSQGSPEKDPVNAGTLQSILLSFEPQGDPNLPFHQPG